MARLDMAVDLECEHDVDVTETLAHHSRVLADRQEVGP